MSALMWWLIPVGATLLAVGYAVYRGRPERPMEGAEGMQTLRAFQDAMNRPLPPVETPAPGPDLHDDPFDSSGYSPNTAPVVPKPRTEQPFDQNEPRS
ncbi:MAG: hypothetical protein WC005_02745 [Candidatus Nanopelagicales bacterium]